MLQGSQSKEVVNVTTNWVQSFRTYLKQGASLFFFLCSPKIGFFNVKPSLISASCRSCTNPIYLLSRNYPSLSSHCTSTQKPKKVLLSLPQGSSFGLVWFHVKDKIPRLCECKYASLISLNIHLRARASRLVSIIGLPHPPT